MLERSIMENYPFYPSYMGTVKPIFCLGNGHTSNGGNSGIEANSKMIFLISQRKHIL